MDRPGVRGGLDPLRNPRSALGGSIGQESRPASTRESQTLGFLPRVRLWLTRSYQASYHWSDR